jgi:hypothetical protein
LTADGICKENLVGINVVKTLYGWFSGEKSRQNEVTGRGKGGRPHWAMARDILQTLTDRVDKRVKQLNL